ncbi:MAG: Gfo/Idh/MocA family protein [Ruthenibacterium sp.]
MIRIGFIGTGQATGVAAWHARAFLQSGRAQITGVYNRMRASGQRWVSQFSCDIRVCASLEELMSRSDALVICTPNHTHHTYAMAAIAAGRHVLLEKPMALTEQQAAELEAAARQARTVCKVGYVYRFAQPVQRLKRLAQEHLGTLYMLDGHMGGVRLADAQVKMEWRMEPAAAGSGALHDFGSHLLDTAYFVSGNTVSSVFCMRETFISYRSGPNGPRAVETDDSASLSCKSGSMLSSFSVSRVGLGPMELSAVGEGGMAVLRLGGNASLTVQQKRKGGPYQKKEEIYTFDEGAQTQKWFCSQAEDFLNGIQGGPTLGAGFSEGAYVDRVLAAALRSVQTGAAQVVSC